MIKLVVRMMAFYRPFSAPKLCKVKLQPVSGFTETQVHRHTLEKSSVNELQEELENFKALAFQLRDEMKIKDEKIQSLESKLEKAGELELQIKEELRNAREAENDMKMLLAESKKMICVLETEVLLEKKADSSSKESIESTKSEIKHAVESHEKSREAMGDLAYGLEVETNHSNEKLRILETELEYAKGEAELLKAMLEEAEFQKNNADKMRIEVEETLMALVEKEIKFVHCIKRAEEERIIAQCEKQKLSNRLKEAREETYKLREVLQKAICEANAANIDVEFAKEEICQLKDCLAKKEEALHFLEHHAVGHENATGKWWHHRKNHQKNESKRYAAVLPI